MRILQVSIQPQGGGAEKVALTLHNRFRQENEAWLTYLYSKFDLDIPNAMYLDIFSLSPISVFVGVKRLFKIARSLKPEVTLVHCEPAMLLTALTPSLGKIFIVEHQPFHWKGFKAVVIKAALRILSLRGSKTIHLRRSRTSPRSPIYIPNPIEICSPHTKYLAQYKTFQIAWVGRLSYDKGFDRIPKVLELAHEKKIEIFGEGPLRRSVSFENINTHFHGFDPNVWEHLPGDSLLLVTSRWEGDGLVILEALMRRIPLLVIHFASIDELPIPTACISKDEDEMASKIRDLRRQHLSLSELVNVDAFQEISSSRNPEEISERYLKVFREI